MSSGNDTPMTRFLFAILQQKCLKDIDWNKVAHDPILAQTISNGHAARMRYSRFRKSMLGIEPQKRNQTAAAKNRVTKSKKDTNVKRTRDDEDVKEDPEAQNSGVQGPTGMESPRVKREMSQLSPDGTMMSSMFSATSAPMSAANMQSHIHGRLLTPCSDSDVLAASANYGASPGSEMLHSDASYDFAGSSPCAHGHDQMAWAHGHTYPAFGVNFDLHSYSTGPSDHHNRHLADDRLGLQQHHHNHHTQLVGQEYGVHHHSQIASEELHVAQSMMEADGNNATVKHEEWDQTAL